MMTYFCPFFKVYGTELEKVEVFNGFQDFVETFYIHRGKVKSKADEEETIVGEFKVKNSFNNKLGKKKRRERNHCGRSTT